MKNLTNMKNEKVKPFFRVLLVGICYLVFGICSITAQHNTVTGILSKCQTYYSTHPRLSFDMDYKMYDSYTSSTVIQQMKGMYHIKDGNVRIQNGGQVQLMNADYAIVADANTSTLVIQENKQQNINRTPLGIDSLVGMFMETKVLKENDVILTLSFNKPKSTFYQVNKFTIDIDKQNGRIIAAVLYYAFDLNEFYDEYNTKTIPRIEISYSNYVEDPVFRENTFSEMDFFKEIGKKLTPSPAYKEYRVLDMRLNQQNHKN